MTVGISLTNGLEAVVITDSRGSNKSSQRKTDSEIKLVGVKGQEHHGVLYATGLDYFIYGLHALVTKETEKSEEEFIAWLSSCFNERRKKSEEEHLIYVREEVERRGLIYADPAQRAHFIQSTIAQQLQAFNEKKNDADTRFMVVVYEEGQNRINMWSISDTGYSKKDTRKIIIGSGQEEADAYIRTKTEGINFQSLSVSDILFFGINAYAYSTQITSVGGIPQIAIVSKDGTRILERERAIALANLSGAYLAAGSKRLTIRNTRKAMRGILEAEFPQYDIVAEQMDTDPKTITGIYIPYSSWQERANRRLFSAERER